MSLIQRFFMAILPKSWGESMKYDSEHWQCRCTTCGTTRTIWEIGGIRWKAYSRGKISLIYCPTCKTLRAHAIEPTPASAT